MVSGGFLWSRGIGEFGFELITIGLGESVPGFGWSSLVSMNWERGLGKLQNGFESSKLVVWPPVACLRGLGEVTIWV